MISQHFIQQRPKRLGVGVELGVKIILDGIIKIQGACNAAGGGQVARVFASACLLQLIRKLGTHHSPPGVNPGAGGDGGIVQVILQGALFPKTLLF